MARERTAIRRGNFVRRLGVAGIACGVLLASSIAEAGNLDAFYLSSNAALQAGAITADSEGGGAIWYNPAGLASLQGLRLDVGVNGYAVRFGGQANLEPASPGTAVTRLTRIDLNVVPTALGITRRFGPFGIGVGAFVPTQSLTVLRTHFLAQDANGDRTFDVSYDASTRIQQYHAGLAVGFQASPRLALGGAFFVTYKTLVDSQDVSLFTSPQGVDVGISTHTNVDSVQVGGAFVLGATYTPLPNWRIGGVVRFPALRLGEITQKVETSLIAGGGSFGVTNQFTDAFDIGTSLITPFRFHLGVSHDFSDSWRGAIEGSLLLPFSDGILEVRQRPTYNGRIGVKHTVGPRFAVGGGIFTDMSPNPEPVEFQESQLNFFGVTAAIDFATTYGVYGKNDQVFEKASVLRFGTTIALSYALGFGSVVQAQLGLNAQRELDAQEVPLDVVAHEITLHIGTTVME